MSTGGEFGQDTNPATNATQPDSTFPSSKKDAAQSKSNSSKSKRKAPRSRSKVWKHFTKFLNEQGEPNVRCNYCEEEFYADPKRNGTTVLKSHLAVCEKRIIDTCSQTGEEEFNQDAIRKALAEMIIVDGLPFRFVDGIGFKEYMSLSCPKFHMPSRWTIARDCYRIYVDEKIKLERLLKDSYVRVSLTIDTWTSLQEVNYLCLTAHFIDKDWKLNKKMLNFCPISSHGGEAIGKMIEKCLHDWGIDRVFSITADNGSSNDLAISYLKKRLSNLGSCIKEGKFLHLRCIAYILNLIVSDELKEMNQSVARVREAVKYVRLCPTRLAEFKECALIENIESKSLFCLDVSTRWNSTYLMLDAAQKFEKAFELLDNIDPDYRSELMMGDGLPERKDWENIRRICLFLRMFYELTVRVSRSSRVTSNSFIDEICIVYSTLRDWETNSDVELNAMAKRMKDKFDKYWGNVEEMNMLLFVASVLDPRKKLEFLKFCFLEMYSEQQASVMVTNVKDALEELFEEYKNLRHLHRQQIDEGCQVSQIVGNDAFGLEKEEDIFSKFKRYKKEIGRDEKKTELDRFLSEEDPKNDVDFDVLAWWKLHSPRFPVLSNMARDVLAAPMFAVASEYAFSTGEPVLDTYRGSLTPMLVQALICAQDWLRKSARFDDIEEDLEELDKLDQDLSEIELDCSID